MCRKRMMKTVEDEARRVEQRSVEIEEDSRVAGHCSAWVSRSGWRVYWIFSAGHRAAHFREPVPLVLVAVRQLAKSFEAS